MPRYAQIVMGPAGSGKSTYCSTLARHCEAIRRTVHIVNLDPAAEHFDYTPTADIRDLIHLDDAMDDDTMRFGPNGGLVFCMEYLTENFDWLEEQLEDIEDDYYIFDCPGQIELYTHIPVMRLLVDQLRQWNFNICGLFLLDSQFLIESTKFISGILAALAAMVTLEIPHFNVMTKIDLLSKKDKKDLDVLLDPDLHILLNEEFSRKSSNRKYERLNKAMASLIDDYSLVKFIALDQTDEESINDLLLQVDSAIQYGEDFEPKERNYDLPDGEPPETEVNLDDYFDS